MTENPTELDEFDDDEPIEPGPNPYEGISEVENDTTEDLEDE